MGDEAKKIFVSIREKNGENCLRKKKNFSLIY